VESKIQAKIIKYLEKQGHETYKVMTASKDGVPDIISHFNGITIYIEAKRPEGRLSEIQKYRIAKLRAQKIPVLVADNLEDAKEWVYKIMEEKKNVSK
jgi:Holliday junction resolvase-like predicted endonuclease